MFERMLALNHAKFDRRTCRHLRKAKRQRQRKCSFGIERLKEVFQVRNLGT